MDSRLEAAFSLLRSTVEQLHSEGRRIYSASLKPELLRRTSNGFDETQLGDGFAKFRHFLELAEKRGVISLTSAPAGPDLLVAPPGASPAGPTASVDATHRKREKGIFIRPELWKAFVFWSDDQVRLYDKETGRVATFSATPVPLEPDEVTKQRELWEGGSSRYVKIDPINRERQVTWMREFAEKLREPLRTSLLMALQNERPFKAFQMTLHMDAATQSEWKARHVRLVAAEIERWVDQAGLAISIYANPVPTASPPDERPSIPETPAVPDLAYVRQQVHAAVDRMPLSKLLELKIPLGYLIDVS
jgi:hypothetical protein